MTENKKAYFAAILYAIIIGFSFFFTKISLMEASPLDTLAHRFTMALLIAIIINKNNEADNNVKIGMVAWIMPASEDEV